MAGRSAPPLLIAVASLIGMAMALPLVYLVLRALGGGWQGFTAVVATPRTVELAARTLALIAGVVVTTMAIALPYAWLVVRTDLPGRRWWALAGALPLVFPSYVAAFALVVFFGPRGHLQSLLGVERLPAVVYGYGGALAALALFTYPYLFLLLVAGLRQLDPAVEESARSLGSGPWGAFRRAVLPQLRGPLAAGGLLVALYVLSDFGAVSIARFNTFTLSIYNAYRGLFDRTAAASLALVLVALTLLVMAVQARWMRRLPATRSRPFRATHRVALGRWKWPVLGALTLLNLVTLAVPLGVVAHWAVRALVTGNPLGRVGESIANSLGVAGLAALAATALALPLAVWSVRYPGRRARAVERLAQSGYALPGMVISLSLVFFATRHAEPLYQTVVLLIAAYVCRFLPQALGAARSALASVAPAFEEAARSLGAGRRRVFRTVTLPLIGPGLAAGAGLVFLTTMKELPATLILRPTGFETLATRVWSATAEGIYSQAALPALCLLLASIVPVYFLMIRPVLGVDGESR